MNITFYIYIFIFIKTFLLSAEVILVAYGDPTSRIRVLDDGLLLDPSLTQVTSHPALRELNSRRRILSVKESFSAHQKRHLVDTIDQT